MGVEPVLLLNDGSRLSLARLSDAGRLDVARLPYELTVEHPAYGRFFDAEGLVVDRHPCGLRLTPTSAEPVLPTPPDTKRWASVLPDGRGAVLGDDHVLLYDGDGWQRFAAPSGVRPNSVTYLGRWWAGGSRGRRPVLFDPTTGVEDSVPWKRRRFSFHVSDGTFANVGLARSGVVVSQDDGLLERSVTHVYLSADDHWCAVYVGDDNVGRVHDEAADLPPVLLVSGRWVVPTAGDTARLLPAPSIGDQLRREAGQRRVSWTWASANAGVVTALVSLWPAGERVLLRAPVGGELAVAHRWHSDGARPVSATVAETSGFDWVSA